MPSRADLLRHPLSLVGVMLATVGGVLFVAFVIATLADLFVDNPYAGLIVFVAMPALFVLGLVLIPLGMWLEQRRRRHHPEAARAWFVFDFRRPATRVWAIAIVAVTVVNLAVVALAGYGSLHYMESPSFCGQVCHEPMHPQFTAWQNAPHSQVACVECHVGEGSRAFVRYKLNGVRQLVHVTTGDFPRPIAGIADMRPAHDVCGACHWSGKDFGDIVRIKREYANDETNTETMTILLLYVGAPGVPTTSGRAIHWHADPRIKIEYLATDASRQTIPVVRVTDAQGGVREYIAEGTTPDAVAALTKGEWRAMDCLDCHNVVAHRVATSAEQAVDDAIGSGHIHRALPFVRREAVRLMKAGHSTVDEAAGAIDAELRKLYASGPHDGGRELARTVETLQDIYRRNVFPVMKVTFGTYPDNIGHTTSSGCFRCHDGSHVAKDGTTINADCEHCHKQLEVPRPSQAAALDKD